MSIGLDWIDDVARWVGNLFPRWDLLDPTEGGVKFKPGGKVVILTPGNLYWWWPATSVIYTMPTKRRTLVFGQRLTTKDDLSVFVETVVVFVVDDVQKALVKTHDFDGTTEEVASKLTVQPITSRTFRETCDDMADSNEMRNELTRKARSLMSEYGVQVLDAYLRSFARTRVLSHDGDMAAVYDDEEDDE